MLHAAACPSTLDYVRLTARHKSMSERGANERPSPFPRSFCVIGATTPPKPAKSELVRKEGRKDGERGSGRLLCGFIRPHNCSTFHGLTRTLLGGNSMRSLSAR